MGLEESGIPGGAVQRGKGMRVRTAKLILFFFFKKEKKPSHLTPKSYPHAPIFLSKHFQQGHKCTGSIDFWLQTTAQAAFNGQFLA